MSIIQGNTKVAAAGGYTIDQSIRFNDNDSAYLTRTPGSTGDRKTYTFSTWVKRGSLGLHTNFFGAGPSNEHVLRFQSNDTLHYYEYTGGFTFDLKTTQVFRDFAWYHIVVSVDTEQATASDRIKIYVNGSQITSFTTASYPSLNLDTIMNLASRPTRVGWSGYLTQYFDGYMADVYLIDGQALAPTDFGEYNDDGVWIAKPFAGGYGSNGFYITGADSADLGADESGNSNDFTSSGLTSADQVIDTPTENYGTLSPLTGSGSVTYADGNLQATQTANYVGSFGTLAVNSGKYYFEYSYAADGNYSDGRLCGGVVCVDTADHGHFRIDGGSFYYPDKTTEGNYMVFHRSGNGQQSNTGTSTSAYNTNLSSSSATGGPESGPDIYMVAMDLDNNNLYWGKNGTWYGASSTSGSDYTDATPIAILSAHQGKYFAPAFYWTGAASGTTTVLNCGQDATFGGRYSSPAGDFYYTPPTGFSKLSTAALPTPTIADGSAYFQATTYTGAGYPTEVNQSGNSTFQPDFVWIKRRSGGAARHDLFDAVRGGSSILESSDYRAENIVSGALTFDSDGFTAAVDPSYGDTGSSGNTFVGWQWLAANGTASNTDGSITSTVSANVDAGFSVIGYTASGTTGATVGHGLSQAPDCIIAKDRDSGAHQWYVYHSAEGATKYGLLNANSPFNTNSGAWNNTEPTSSLVTLGTSAFGAVNNTGNDHIMYCWHSVPGYSLVGQYTGNGSADGPFVWCGFRPAFMLIKKTTASDSWEIFDSERPGYNVTNLGLYANTTDSELTGRDMDLLSNGFKVRNANGTTNTSGATHIFMAFAEHPFGGDGVAPVPAR